MIARSPPGRGQAGVHFARTGEATEPSGAGHSSREMLLTPVGVERVCHPHVIEIDVRPTTAMAGNGAPVGR